MIARPPTMPRKPPVARKPRRKPTTPRPAPRRPTVTRPTQPQPPAQQAAAATPSGGIAVPPPAATYRGDTGRIDARDQYGNLVNNVNYGLSSLGQQYGLGGPVTQFGFRMDPETGRPIDDQFTLPGQGNTPGSVAERLATALAGQQRSIDATHNANNTFFSGLRLNDRGYAQTDYEAQIAAAQREYNDAVQRYMAQIFGGRTDRDTSFREATATDLEAAASAPPENQQVAAPTPVVRKPAPGYQFIDARGWSYNLRPGPDGKLWRFFANGKKERR